jgi:hypothetical protein
MPDKPFHGGDTGSTPVRDAKNCQQDTVIFGWLFSLMDTFKDTFTLRSIFNMSG